MERSSYTGKPQVVELALGKIKTNGGTQQRVSIDREHVADMAAALRAGVKLPPGRVYFDGRQHWLAAGHHRLLAHREAELNTMPVEVVEGSVRDAILYSVGDNAEHLAIRRTNADKRCAVSKLLADPEWSQWSDRQISERCRVSHVFVGRLRSISHTPSLVTLPVTAERKYTTRHGTTATMNTGNIGLKPPPESRPDPSIIWGEQAEGIKPKAPAPDQIRDGLGQLVHNPKIAAVFRRQGEVRELLNAMTRIKCAVEGAIEKGDDLFAMFANDRGSFQQWVAAMKSARFTLKQMATPYALCPYHGDDPLATKTCGICKGLGYLGVTAYGMTDSRVREQSLARSRAAEERGAAA